MSLTVAATLRSLRDALLVALRQRTERFPFGPSGRARVEYTARMPFCPSIPAHDGLGRRRLGRGTGGTTEASARDRFPIRAQAGASWVLCVAILRGSFSCAPTRRRLAGCRRSQHLSLRSDSPTGSAASRLSSNRRRA